ncbi:MAG: CDP-diacylglycerol--glycerol-3-phosphate 3-phosphatidyltransferase [Candidatus Izemoplasmatales bacterium]|nr:CDP-diacylglycerol--glycerol-3-phosphate 3-phosphatidyltransferase [Candidatus Izemoplasmatales bacterium]
MNLPNKLTMIRIFIIPFIVIVYFFNNWFDSLLNNLGLYIMGVFFILASVTDYFDGKIARKRNIVTTFGKFIDPLADKLLVTTALIILSNYFYVNGVGGNFMWMPFWVVLVVITRDLIVTSIRLVAINEGVVVAAKWSGKLKTAFTMITIVYYFFIMPFNVLVITIIGIVLTLIFVILTVYSAVDYFLKNKEIIFKEI